MLKERKKKKKNNKLFDNVRKRISIRIVKTRESQLNAAVLIRNAFGKETQSVYMEIKRFCFSAEFRWDTGIGIKAQGLPYDRKHCVHVWF